MKTLIIMTMIIFSTNVHAVTVETNNNLCKVTCVSQAMLDTMGNKNTYKRYEKCFSGSDHDCYNDIAEKLFKKDCDSMCNEMF